MTTSASKEPDSHDRPSPENAERNPDLRYPIGAYSPPSAIRRAELDAWIAELSALPPNLRQAVDGLSDNQSTPRIAPEAGRLARSSITLPTAT